MAVPPIPTQALWKWDNSTGTPVATGYSSGKTTKSGLQYNDLQDFCTIPLQNFFTGQPLSVGTLTKFIRMAEDQIETETNLLLCQSWVASPPAVTPQQAQAIGVTPNFASGYQVLGYDYDIEDAAYDFFFQRAQDEGWMNYSLRYRPVKSMSYSPQSPTAIKNVAYIYPLLNEFFNVPASWLVEDHDFGLVRFVPATNVQMLPLFAMQLAFMGFAESVPGGIWFQYTAGLTPADYNSRWGFINQLILSAASVVALASIQATINMGIAKSSMNIDGVAYTTEYDKKGPLAGAIEQFEKQRDYWMAMAKDRVSGPMIGFL